MTNKIRGALWDGLPFRAKCKRTGGVTEGEDGFTLKVKLTSSQKKYCIYKLDRVGGNKGSVGEMCDYLHSWYSQSARSSKVYYKAEKYWKDTLLDLLFGETGVLSQIKMMAENHEIDESITEILKAEYSKPKYQNARKKDKKEKKRSKAKQIV